MSSKLPLLLAFENYDPHGDSIRGTMLLRFPAIFKVGDDLRQDQLTIAIFNVLDHILQQHGGNQAYSDLQLIPTCHSIDACA